MKNCQIKRNTVSKALKEMKGLGLLKVKRRTSSQGRAHNHYTVYPTYMLAQKTPTEEITEESQLEEMLAQLLTSFGSENVRKLLDKIDAKKPIGTENTGIEVSSQEIRTTVHERYEPQYIRDTNHSTLEILEGLHILRATHIKGEREAAAPPENPPSHEEKNEPPAAEEKTAYGSYKNVMLSQTEYDNLVNDFGEGKAKEYIQRCDFELASRRVTYRSHEATIRKWIYQDEAKAKKEAAQAAQKQNSDKPKRNRFANFEGRERNYAEIERLEQEHRLKSLETATDTDKDTKK